MVERANGFLETSFLPGRDVRLAGRLQHPAGATGWPTANTRVAAPAGEPPGVRLGDRLRRWWRCRRSPPAVGLTNRVRLGRDYYVRVAGNDYSVDPR